MFLLRKAGTQDVALCSLRSTDGKLHVYMAGGAVGGAAGRRRREGGTAVGGIEKGHRACMS